MGFLIPLALFLCIAAIIVFSGWSRAQERRAALQVIERMVEKGQEAPPALLAAASQPPQHPALRDLRLGLVMLAMSGGFLFMAWSQWRFSKLADPYVNGSMVGAAAFPGLIGLVLVGFWAFNRNRPGVGGDI